MPIIIDGWNLIRNDRSDIDDTGRDSLSSVETLISYLDDFLASHRDPIIVVFDSSSGFLGIDRKRDPLLSVVPAKSADAYIRKYIDGVPERQRRNLRVVSSDNEIYYYAKSAYAKPVKSEEFWAKLKGNPPFKT